MVDRNCEISPYLNLFCKIHLLYLFLNLRNTKERILSETGCRIWTLLLNILGMLNLKLRICSRIDVFNASSATWFAYTKKAISMFVSFSLQGL